MSEHGSVEETSEELARILAQDGIAAIEQMQTIVNRARQMSPQDIAAGSPGIQAPGYAWEENDNTPLGVLPSVWTASVDDYATGEGLSVYFIASFATGENAFRRRLAVDLGRELANRAHVREGVGGLPFTSMFLSPSLQARIAAFQRGEDRPATFSFSAVYRSNSS